jgi:hypothetical protein
MKQTIASALILVLSFVLCIKWFLTPKPREQALTGLMCMGVIGIIISTLEFNRLCHFLPQPLDLNDSWLGFFRGLACGVMLSMLITGQLRAAVRKGRAIPSAGVT